MDREKLVDELAELCGIIPEYHDIWGKPRSVSCETKEALLRAMGYDTGSAEGLRSAIEGIRRKRDHALIEPVMVVSVGNQPPLLPIRLPLDDGLTDAAVRCTVTDEEGRREVTDVRLDRAPAAGEAGGGFREVAIPNRVDRGIGYYDVRVDVTAAGRSLSGRMRLIITPERCYLPPGLTEGGRTWGLAVNLYALRSGRDQGVGDLTDLKDLIEWVGGELGGGFVAINPLHSITNQSPYGISPYSPVSRLYSNLIYIDILRVEDVFASERARAVMESPGFLRELHRVREAGLVDYEAVARLKRVVLDAAFLSFYELHYLAMTERGEEFRRYLSSEGRALQDYATFMALYEHFSASGLHHWKDWPTEYRSPETEEVKTFKERHEPEVVFHEYLQWLIDQQLDDVSRKAGDSGMVVGLYRDLAVGSLAAGSDVWANQGIFAPEVDVGAPPDDFNPKGQNWGFPPLIPERLREQGYEFFVQLIRKNLRRAGALRIDHALGLFRLFWIPRGAAPDEGAYVGYPHEDLLRIIALESVRNRAVIVAEDLGTMSEGVREALQRFGMLSFRLFYFERDYSTGEFLPPEAYPAMAITSTTTHDLPTLSGFWAGRDIEVKKRLHMYPDEEAFRSELRRRESDRARILRALRDAGLLPGADTALFPVMTEELCLAIYRFLGMTPSKLLMVNLDDVLGTLDQQNLPGTIDEYPNWRRKTPLALEEMRGMDLFRRVAGIRG